jgi:hypothetical protein
MQMRIVSIAFTGMLLALPGFADFSYKETTKITGGSITKMMKMIPGGGKALEPQTSAIYLKGNKLATVHDRAINIIDLDAETITDINLEKKTYSVITFQEMAAAMEAAQRKMQEEMQKQSGQSSAQLSFHVKVSETSQRKQISGLDTKEMLMLLELQAASGQSDAAAMMTMDVNLWMAPDVPGYEQVRDFYTRMAGKMNWHPRMSSLAAAMNVQPGLGQGMAEMMKEAQKLEGVPVLQTTKMYGGAMGALGEMPSLSDALGGRTAGEAAGEAAADQARRSASDRTARAAGGGRFGGLAGAATSGVLGGLGRRRRQEPQPQQEPEADASQPAKTPFMEMTSESSDFSTAPVDASKFAIPAGFKQVEHEMKKLLH